MAYGIHTEQTFEAAIEEGLLTNGGYVKGHSNHFDAHLGLFPTYITEFLKTSQPKSWTKVSTIHKTGVEQKVLQRLLKELDLRGTLDVLRNGFTDYGVKFRMAYFKPESSLNPDAVALYDTNHLSVTRQVFYERDGKNSLDMVFALNGLPVATVELKNQFSGQNVQNAKKQYVYDREPSEPIFQFKKRALVHFAVDADECFMTTKLAGKKTRYLPFNLGYNNGAGNPPNANGYRTSYLWEKVWTKDSFLDLIGKFLHISSEEYELNGIKKIKETVIFPRFHQMEVVRKVTEDARVKGAGHNYLIQHSAGSGKSNSIAWLSYRLSSLHDSNDERVFDSVIVITDRKVLDNQLQNTIYQFEHKEGVVQKIDKDSQQLADALSAGSNIIITTLQKFPFILTKIGDIPSRKYAVIVDEAHSSQGGEAAKKMKEVLAAKSLEEAVVQEDSFSGLDEDAEDEIRKSMEARGKQSNLSFFAFTATPKAKTVEVFGIPDTDGKPKPFHLYSMKQAIEEKFILDVLQNYTTYSTYFKLSKQIEDDPNVNKKQASRAIARFLSLHPHNLAQKTEVIVEHFRQVVSKKLGGKAKAMVVTSSRLHAVRYKEEFDRYIKDRGYTDIKSIVAFSGKVIYDVYPDGVTEVELNGFKEKEVPKKFATDEYQLLLVADKYQTGFDQPLLHTMYVDKKLSGVKAVQTLSRLNRMHPGKDDTFVLDFANDTEDILDSFQPYYELTTIESTTDPNRLYDLKHEIEKAQVIWNSEVDNFCNVFFKSTKSLSPSEQKKLYGYTSPAVERFKQLPEENENNDVIIVQTTQENFKHAVQSFTRLYSFLTQIMPFSDVELEKLYTYGRFLLKVLPRSSQDKFALGDEVSLEYYRLQKVGETSIMMDSLDQYELRVSTDAGIRMTKEEKAALSEIIEILNKKFSTEFNDADKLFFDQIEAELVADAKLGQQARSNTLENFKFGFEDIFMDKLIGRMEQNQDIFSKMMDDNEFGMVVKNYMLKKVYASLKKPING